MINIKIFEKSNKILGIECSGHSGYSEYGSDIVCSAVSTLVGNCLLGLKQVIGVKVEHKQDDNNAYFKLMLKEEKPEAQMLLQTTVLSLQNIAKQYKKYITIEKIGG